MSEVEDKALDAFLGLVADKGFAAHFHDPNPDCGFVADDYWTWGIHFTESGYAKIAASWWKALQPVLQAMLVARLLEPASKLATHRALHDDTATSSLGRVLGVGQPRA